jgi:outer membrane protein assembly factor BamA
MEQQSLSLSVSQPYLGDGKYLLVGRIRYRFDPQRDFFGLGNNDQGPDPASTNSFQDFQASLTAGWRPSPRLALNLTVRVRDVAIGNGDRLGSCGDQVPCPFTEEAFPDLPGVEGGSIVPFALSAVWNNRDDVVRPTRGWRAIAKIIHTNRALGDFEFTRYIVDLGYLRSFLDRRLVLGARIDGEWVQGPESDIPYWELAELGGDDTMRGFFPHRFVGKGRALINLEAKFLILEFDFFDVWHIKLDGVVFGDGGRVFLDAEDAEEEFKLNEDLFGRIVSDFRYSYGGGVRFALGEALTARIDVGFSEEETGLIYLAFGHTF